MESGRSSQKSGRKTLVHLLVHSHFAPTIRCAHSFARSLTHSRARGKVIQCLKMTSFCSTMRWTDGREWPFIKLCAAECRRYLKWKLVEWELPKTICFIACETLSEWLISTRGNWVQRSYEFRWRFLVGFLLPAQLKTSIRFYIVRQQFHIIDLTRI